jgi:peptide/nickel transport system substrate-binding protein
MKTSKFAKLITIILAAIFIGVLIGCTTQPTTAPDVDQPPQTVETEAPQPEELEPVTITIVTPIDPESLDPAFDTSIKAISVMSQVYDRLIWRDISGELIPSLAASWEFIDPTTLELKLREGVTFHDGGDFTAEDVVFTFERLLDEDNPLPLSSYVVGSITSVEKIDDYTVRITTPSPRALLLAEIFRIAIVSKDAVEAAGEAYGLNPIGTGPFKFVQWDKNEKIVFEAFDEHWRGRSEFDQVTFRIMPDDFARYASLTAGEVDIISNLPPERIEEVDADPNLNTAMVHSARNMFVGMNTWEPPFDDPRVRAAMNYAVDVQLIIDTIFNGHAYLNRNICSQVITGYDPDFEGYTYDPDKAKELLAEAGYPDGFEINFWGPNGKYVKDKEVQEAMGAFLVDVGITVTHIMPEWAEYWGKYKPGDLDGLMFLSTGNPLLDCDMTMVYRMYSKTAGQYFNSPELDAMIEKEQAEVDPAKRQEIFVEIQQYVKEQAPWIFLYDQQDPYGVSARIDWQPRSDELEWVYDMHVTE